MATAMIDDNFVTVKRASEIIGCTHGRVLQLIYDKALEGTKMRGLPFWFVRLDQVNKMAENPPKTGRPRKFKK